MKALYHNFASLGILAAAAFAPVSISASYPAGYYDSLEGKCGYDLMVAVKAIAKGHTEISYSSGTWKAFKDTDVKTVDGVDYWWDMYSNDLVKVSSGHGGLNVEHSVPNSWWGGVKNAAYKDLVHLNPSDATANNRKSNYPLGEVSNVTWTNGVTTVGSPKSGQGGGKNMVFEPAEEYKGDFARAYMYMFATYNDIDWQSKNSWMYTIGYDLMFKSWAKELLLRWSAGDPVSDKERWRNDGVYLNQRNRNPFIDLPDLADHIWGDKNTVPFSLEGSGEGPVNPGDLITYEWLSETETALPEGWEIEDISLGEGISYVWSWKTYNGAGYLNGSAYASGSAHESEAYAWSPAIDMRYVLEPTVKFDHAAKFQTTCRELCKFAVREVESGEIHLLDIPSWPEAGKWTFRESGTIDLSEFIGKEVRLGFRYGSTDTGADTWEIRNMVFRAKSDPSAIELPTGEEFDDSDMVEVWGNTITVPEGARIFDLNGREVNGVNAAPGLYIVTKPTFTKSVKVIVK